MNDRETHSEEQHIADRLRDYERQWPEQQKELAALRRENEELRRERDEAKERYTNEERMRWQNVHADFTRVLADLSTARQQLAMAEHNWHAAEQELRDTLEPYRKQTAKQAAAIRLKDEALEYAGSHEHTKPPCKKCDMIDAALSTPPSTALADYVRPLVETLRLAVTVLTEYSDKQQSGKMTHYYAESNIPKITATLARYEKEKE